MSNMQRKERDLRIDFFRGLALIFIFIDHVPDNSWAKITLKNFGFSDASEVFVLLAGYSAGLAYWSMCERGDFQGAWTRATRRASQIYLWHIGIFIVSAMLLFGAARMGPDPATSVVDLDFRVHGTEGLYVVDSSVFPTNLGVNPQHSIMALSRLAASGIAERALGRRAA